MLQTWLLSAGQPHVRWHFWGWRKLSAETVLLFVCCKKKTNYKVRQHDVTWWFLLMTRTHCTHRRHKYGVCYLIAASRRDGAQTHRPLTQCKLSEGKSIVRKAWEMKKRACLSGGSEAHWKVDKWRNGTNKRGMCSVFLLFFFNLMRCGNGPDHSRVGGGEGCSSRHFAFQTKAKLKLRHGLLNMAGVNNRHNDVRSRHGYDRKTPRTGC